MFFICRPLGKVNAAFGYTWAMPSEQPLGPVVCEEVTTYTENARKVVE